MSLITKISALATSVGTTVKALTTRVTALEAPITINTYTADRTATSADVNAEAQMDKATAITFTIDPATITAGRRGLVRQIGVGQVTIAVASGTLVKSGPTAKTSQKGAMISWLVQSSTLVYINGEVAAS